jgi:MYXO-CTERM domain-containing protein
MQAAEGCHTRHGAPPLLLLLLLLLRRRRRRCQLAGG